VEHYARSADVWRFESLTKPTETLSLDGVGFAMTLKALYFDLAL